MIEWQVVLPVWGQRYCDIFERASLPALRAAIERLALPTELVIYTHDTERLAAACLGLSFVIRPVPGPDDSFYSMSGAHRDALQRAAMGQRVALLTADLVVSPNSFKACEAHFRHRKMLVACAGMRVNDTEIPPAFSSGRELVAWGWDRRHAMTRESTWPDGHSYDIWRMYFEKDGEAASRLCLPHPIALVRDRREVRFAPTVDVNVVANFDTREMHMVTDPDEVAMIELSPPEKEFLLTEPMIERYNKNLASMPPFIKLTHPRQRWFFGHRILIKGTGGDCGDQEVKLRLLDGA